MRLVEDIDAQVNGFTFVADLASWKMVRIKKSKQNDVFSFENQRKTFLGRTQ